MNNPNVPDAKHRGLIRIWLQEEEQRRKAEEQPPQLAVGAQSLAEVEKLFRTALKGAKAPSSMETIKKKAQALVTKGIEDAASGRGKVKLPTQYEREQCLMNFKRMLPVDRILVTQNAAENRDDVFIPTMKMLAGVKNGFNNQEGNPDVNRVENWSIWAYVWGRDGGDACWSSLYWRYRIWVPNFDTSRQSDRRLVVTPHAALLGYYDVFAQPSGGIFGFFQTSPQASVNFRFWTGTWHWHYNGVTYDPEWTGWKRSYDIVNRQTTHGNIHQDINVPYPGTEVITPSHFDPPGVITQPNPGNYYGSVKPFDVVDFYVRPQLCAQTDSYASYAKLDFSLIDVPFVTASFEEGYYL